MRVERGKLPRWVVWCASVLAAWAVLAGLLVMQLLPGTPETAREWVILLVLGPPAWLLLEWGASRIVGVKSGASASSAPISATRILKGLAVALVVIAPLVLWALRRAP